MVHKINHKYTGFVTNVSIYDKPNKYLVIVSHISLFFNIQWQKDRSRIRIWYLVYRWAWALYHTAWAIYLFIEEGSVDSSFSRNLYFFTYLTNWAYTTLTVMNLHWAITTTIHFIAEKRDHRRSSSVSPSYTTDSNSHEHVPSDKTRAWHITGAAESGGSKRSDNGNLDGIRCNTESIGWNLGMLWLLQNLTYSVALTVTTVYWLALYEPGKSKFELELYKTKSIDERQ